MAHILRTKSCDEEGSPLPDKMEREYRQLQLPFGMSVSVLAMMFCNMDDELQADFFVEVAKIAEKWDRPQSMQWDKVGKHLSSCECSTPEAKHMVMSLAQPLFDTEK